MSGVGSQALALAFPGDSLLTATERQVVGQALVVNVEAHGLHPYAGDLSVTYLFDALSEQGHPDAVVAMTSNQEQPGWGFMVEQGATSMYESWYTDRYSSIGSRFHDMFVGPYLYFFTGLGGLSQQQDSVGWKRLRIAPQAYNFWSDAVDQAVSISAASWGGNCENLSAHQDFTAAVREACAGKTECGFVIPDNSSLCGDVLPPAPPPSPPVAPPPPVCAGDGCHMIGLPSEDFFVGVWSQEFSNVTTEADCKAACLKSPTCRQITWLMRPKMPVGSQATRRSL